MTSRSGPAAHRPESHRTHRSGWLRAAVLGADDGIVSTSSLMIGIVAAHGGRSAVLTAGLAGLAAGAMAMAAGEYVSVAAQRDTEHADLDRERAELAASPDMELRELASLYERRGLAPDLAAEVAVQLTAHDALAAHARDELGLTVGPRAPGRCRRRPLPPWPSSRALSSPSSPCWWRRRRPGPRPSSSPRWSDWLPWARWVRWPAAPGGGDRRPGSWPGGPWPCSSRPAWVFSPTPPGPEGRAAGP